MGFLKRGLIRWVLLAVVAIGVVVVGGTYFYIHVLDRTPSQLTLPAAPASDGPEVTSTITSLDGTWNLASGSTAEYQVKEVLFGQSHTAVGSTRALTGSLTVANGVLTAGSFSASMTTVTSDKSQRDGQFNGRIMQTATYPTATFRVTQPVTLGSIPSYGVVETRQVIGDLSLHGTTRSVTFSVSMERIGSVVSTKGTIPITFAYYNIANPSFAGVVTTDQNGLLVFQINFVQAAN